MFDQIKEMNWIELQVERWTEHSLEDWLWHGSLYRSDSDVFTVWADPLRSYGIRHF